MSVYLYLFVCLWVCVNAAESLKDAFRDAELLPMLKKMLEDPAGAVEVKFSALGLICSLANSSMFFILFYFFTTHISEIQISRCCCWLWVKATRRGSDLSSKHLFNTTMTSNLITQNKWKEKCFKNVLEGCSSSSHHTLPHSTSLLKTGSWKPCSCEETPPPTFSETVELYWPIQNQK